MSKVRLMHDDRINLQAAIAKGYSLEQCSRLLNKSRSTIYREIINNCYYKPCRHTCYHCSKLCLDKPPFVRGECPDFNAFRCRRWKRFPYTCNGCENASICSNLKRYYDCVDAESSSQKKRIEPRVFKRIDANDLTAIDQDDIKEIRR